MTSDCTAYVIRFGCLPSIWNRFDDLRLRSANCRSRDRLVFDVVPSDDAIRACVCADKTLHTCPLMFDSSGAQEFAPCPHRRMSRICRSTSRLRLFGRCVRPCWCGVTSPRNGHCGGDCSVHPLWGRRYGHHLTKNVEKGMTPQQKRVREFFHRAQGVPSWCAYSKGFSDGLSFSAR